jgi:ferredoxin
MSRPVWFVRMVQAAFPSRFSIAAATRRWPRFGKFIDRFLFDGDDVIYLPKDNLIPVNQSIAAPAETVLPSEVAAHFVEQANHLFIMDRCFCREADQCEDYPIDIGCLFMGEAVHKINPKLGHLATREEAHAHLARAREAGLVHMIGRNRIDYVWMGVGPYGKLLTICNCCPCCCLWRVLPDLPDEIRTNVSAMPGVSVTVTDRCVGCGACADDVCFVNAIQMVDGRAVISEACLGCGRCVEVCPTGAITLTVSRDTFVLETIERLSPLVDIA